VHPVVTRGIALLSVSSLTAVVCLGVAGCGSSSSGFVPGAPDAANAPDATAPSPDGGPPPGGDASPDAPPSDAPASMPPVTVDQSCGGTLAMRVTVLEDAAVRFHYIQNGTPQADRGWVYDLTKFAGPHTANVTQDASHLAIQTDALQITITGATCSIQVQDRSGTTLWQEAAAFASDPTNGVSLGRRLATGERIFGLGEKTGSASRIGRSFEMWNSDPAWSDPSGQYQTTSDPIYQSHPFFVSVLEGGHTTGAFLANTNHTYFDVGKTAADALAMRAAAGDVDLFFFEGPHPGDVLERYTRLVGRATLQPLWTLGYNQSRWSYTPAQRVLDVALKLRSEALPADGMWLDIDYMNGFRDFTWDPIGFPDPAGTVSTLANNGFKVTTIFDPGVKQDTSGGYAAYNTGLAGGDFTVGSDGNPVVATCWPGNALFPDFTDPKARAFWGDQLGMFLQAGTRGTWIDMNEPAVFAKQGFPLDAKVAGEGKPTTFGEVKNVYAFLMARATYEGQLKAFPNRRPFILTRAGFSGIQRYASVWTGDAQSTWGFLGMMPSMLQGMSMSGMAMIGSDVGGFTGSPAPELYGRWFEVGSISPFFRTHVATGTPDQEPWSFGSEVEDDARAQLGLRYTMMPYWYDAYVAATKTGAPILRPLWYTYADDDEAFKHEDEVFIGDSILAAPVLANQVTQRDVYLPKGVFYDLYSGAAYTGPTTVTMPAPLGRFPIFVRAGSIVPEQDLVQYTDATSNGKTYFDVYPGGAGTTAQASHYEDDGASLAYQTGGFSTTAVTSAVDGSGVTIDVGARTGAYQPTGGSAIVRVHGVPAAPSSVQIDGNAAQVAYDLGSRTVTVALPDRAAHHVVVAYDTSALPPARQVSLAFTVTLPSNTPAGSTVYAASSFGGWQPNALALATTGTTATGTLSVPEGTLVKYKITRGTWATVEVDGSCASIANRSLTAAWGTNGTDPVAITVAHWTDVCP
jgi:alpha-glucosidase